MDWTDDQQAKFDELRQRELTSVLTPAEQLELDSLMAIVMEAADQALIPVITRLQQEQALLIENLQQRQNENEELANLLHQQEQLVWESQRWLAEFDRRHAQIHDTYTRLTGNALTSA